MWTTPYPSRTTFKGHYNGEKSIQNKLCTVCHLVVNLCIKINHFFPSIGEHLEPTAIRLELLDLVLPPWNSEEDSVEARQNKFIMSILKKKVNKNTQKNLQSSSAFVIWIGTSASHLDTGKVIEHWSVVLKWITTHSSASCHERLGCGFKIGYICNSPRTTQSVNPLLGEFFVSVHHSYSRYTETTLSSFL